MTQRLECWLLAHYHQHRTFNMGLATIELKRGTAPASPPPTALDEAKNSADVEIEETIFAFAKAPEEPIAKVVKGGNSGAKVQLTQPSRDGGRNKGNVGGELGGS